VTPQVARSTWHDADETNQARKVFGRLGVDPALVVKTRGGFLARQHGSEYEDRIRALLRAIREGDRSAFNALIEAIGQEMRGLSGYILLSRPPVQTMQVTVLVNEAVLRLIRMLNREAEKFPETKEHLMNLLSRMMRFTLTDYARKRKVGLDSLDEPQRGPDGEPGDSTAGEMLQDWSVQDLDFLLAVDRGLDAIEHSDPVNGKRRRAAIELHLFSGMNFREIGEELGITDDTARRDCQVALSRLREILGDEPPAAAPVRA
jgi:RNA polymerase sigma factor (sigma-70 family)